MKINYSTKNNQINVEFDANSIKEAFKNLAEFQEIFDESNCGSCNSENIRFLVRNVDGNDYFELRCKDCFSKLAFGQHKNGEGLFPKRKLADGSFDSQNKGWHKWIPNNN